MKEKEELFFKTSENKIIGNFTLKEKNLENDNNKLMIKNGK